MRVVNQRYTGTIKWINPDKRFGFVSVDDGEEDVFVHHSDIKGEGKRLGQNQRIEFTFSSEGGTSRAREVTDLDGTPLQPTPAQCSCPHRTILLSGLKKSFLRREQPGHGTEEGPIRTLLMALNNSGVAAVNWIVFYRSRTALVEYATGQDAEKVVEYCFTHPLVVPGAAWRKCEDLVVVSAGNQPYKPEKVKRSTEDQRCVQKAVADCISSMVKEVVKRESEENRVRRAIERKQHQALLRELAKQAGGKVREDVCWDFVMANGRPEGCKRGDSCKFVHELVPVHLMPLALRHFTVHGDTFPEQREAHAEKESVNAGLVEASAGLANKKCLVLDGAQCNSTKALLGCKQQQRQKEDVVVPNSCTQTYLAIKAAGLCLPYLGSLRAFIDENAAKQSQTTADEPSQLLLHFRPTRHWRFGLVYLDYCSSLDAGFRSIEKNPKEDIRALFESGSLDTDTGNAVLAVTVAVKTKNTPDGCCNSDDADACGHRSKAAEVALKQVVVGIAADNALKATTLRSFEFAKTTVCLFLISRPLEAAAGVGEEGGDLGAS